MHHCSRAKWTTRSRERDAGAVRGAGASRPAHPAQRPRPQGNHEKICPGSESKVKLRDEIENEFGIRTKNRNRKIPDPSDRGLKLKAGLGNGQLNHGQNRERGVKIRIDSEIFSFSSL
ncbi:hypothetical protein EVAR_33657_1 [Eumeta japonica]|uniref:Uncharacterized protein n=1 Tax=Eumeta variegata TaxID=151549 RepID=A0A4C1VN06_EUMVA|nr:hypothetical protein EVAR_33657_1 [Eumeta japonica]